MRRYSTLVRTLQDAQGVPFSELASAHGIDLSKPGANQKGIAGRLVEAVLGKAPDAKAEADLSYFGLEIKTIPIDLALTPREMTKVTMLNYVDVYDQPWEHSTVYHKLRNILFVPIVKRTVATPLEWYIRDPFVWMPSIAVERQLREDYESIRSLVRAGKFDEISSKKPPEGQGVYLIANTAGKDAKDFVSFSLGGAKTKARRRAFMMRKDLTERILDENVRYHPASADSEPADDDDETATRP